MLAKVAKPKTKAKTHLRLLKPKPYDPRKHGADCDNCPFQGLTPVPPSLPTAGKVDAILVGEGPGFYEVREGTPFVGPSGKRLNQILAKHGLDRAAMHVTNATLCVPTKDKDNFLKAAVKCCAPRLERELAKYPASVPIVPLGTFALRSVTGHKKASIMKSRGFVWQKDGRDIMPTIHPALVLYDGLQAPLFSRDIRRLAQRVRDGHIALSKPDNYFVPRTAKELKELLIRFGKFVACDIETTREPATKATLQCIGISNSKTTIVIPWDKAFAHILQRFFEHRVVVGHNFINFDSIVLRRYGIDIKSIEDTMVAHHSYAAHLRQGMDHLVSFYEDSEPWKIIHGMSGKDEKGQPKKELTEEQLHKYNAYDCHLEFLTWFSLQADLAPYKSLYEQDKELAFMCRDMQENGVNVDRPRKDELSKAILAKEKRLFKEMKEIAGRDFTPTKTDDIREILYNQFKAPIIERTEKAQLPSTSKKVLAAFAAVKDRPYAGFAQRMIEWRACGKMRVTYLDNLPVDADGRVRPNWRSTGTVSGRFSCQRPNLQNLKRFDKRFRNEPEQHIREIYIASKGNILMAFDLSQVEPRVAAYLSNDPVFIEGVESGDIHTTNAKRIFDNHPYLMDPKEAKEGKGKPMRDISKTSVLAMSYMSSPETVWRKLQSEGFDVTLRKITEVMDKLKKIFKVYYAYVGSNEAICKRSGFLTAGALSGRRCWVGHHPETSKVANTPIQFTAGDIMNRKLLAIWKRLPKKVKLVAQVHDSGVFDLPPQYADMLEKIVRGEIDKPIEINGHKVVFPCDLKRGMRMSEV